MWISRRSASQQKWVVGVEAVAFLNHPFIYATTKQPFTGVKRHASQHSTLWAKKHNKVIINTANLTTFNMTNVLMHEISHPVGSLDHVDTSQAPCGPLDSDPRVLSNRNLMCGASRWAGRLLTPAQCTAIYSNTNVNVKIANLNQ